jgi:hypothetical protein
MYMYSAHLLLMGYYEKKGLTVQPISTELTTTSYLKSLNTKNTTRFTKMSYNEIITVKSQGQ